MGASVRVDEDAFLDVRFDQLAQELGLTDADHARGKMLRVWRWCTVEQRQVIPLSALNHLLGSKGGHALVASDLGVEHPKGIRVKGTKGRIEWLGKLRHAGKLGAEFGKLGGRPRKTPKGVIEKPLGGLEQKPLLSLSLALDPALTPVQDQNQNHKPSRKKPALAFDAVGFDAFWAVYPRKIAKGDARRAWMKLRPDERLRATILGALSRQVSCDDWSRDDGQYIPYPATWLNGARWEDEATEPMDPMDNLRARMEAIHGKTIGTT